MTDHMKSDLLTIMQAIGDLGTYQFPAKVIHKGTPCVIAADRQMCVVVPRSILPETIGEPANPDAASKIGSALANMIERDDDSYRLIRTVKLQDISDWCQGAVWPLFEFDPLEPESIPDWDNDDLDVRVGDLFGLTVDRTHIARALTVMNWDNPVTNGEVRVAIPGEPLLHPMRIDAGDRVAFIMGMIKRSAKPTPCLVYRFEDSIR